MSANDASLKAAVFSKRPEDKSTLSDLRFSMLRDKSITSQGLYGSQLENSQINKKKEEEINENLFNTEESNFQVIVRLRPIPQESLINEEGAIAQPQEDLKTLLFGKNVTQLSRSAISNSPVVSYTFDRVFDDATNQAYFYQKGMASLFNAFMQGVNCNVWTYGQTRSGKSYTLEGTGDQENRGIIPRFIEDIFEHSQKIIGENQTSRITPKINLKVSVIQIFNDVVSDLLVPNSHNLKILENKEKSSSYISGLTKKQINHPSEYYDLSKQTKINRSVPKTMGAKPPDLHTRCHTITTLYLEQLIPLPRKKVRSLDKSPQSMLNVGLESVANESRLIRSKIHFIELPGAEKSRDVASSLSILSGVNNDVVLSEDSAKIAKSFNSITTVLSSLNLSNKYIPYRDAKLTYFLKETMNNYSLNLFICTVYPLSHHYNETQAVLKFATRIRQISKSNVSGTMTSSGIKAPGYYPTEIINAQPNLPAKENPAERFSTTAGGSRVLSQSAATASAEPDFDTDSELDPSNSITELERPKKRVVFSTFDTEDKELFAKKKFEDDLKRENSIVKMQILDTKNELIEEKQENQLLRQQNDELECQTQMQKSQESEMRREIEKLKLQLLEAKNELLKEKEDKERFKKKNQDLLQLMSSLQQQEENIKQTSEENKIELIQAKNFLIEEIQKRELVQEEKETVDKTVDSLRSEIDKFKQQVQQQASQIQQNQNKIMDEKTKVADLKRQNEEVRESLKKAEGRELNLKNQILDLENAKEQDEMNDSQIKKKLEEKNDILRVVQDKLLSKEQQIEDAMTKLHQTKIKLSKTENVLEQTRKQLEESEEKLSSLLLQNADYKLKILKSREELLESQRKEKMLEGQLGDLEQELKYTTERINMCISSQMPQN